MERFASPRLVSRGDGPGIPKSDLKKKFKKLPFNLFSIIMFSVYQKTVEILIQEDRR